MAPRCLLLLSLAAASFTILHFAAATDNDASTTRTNIPNPNYSFVQSIGPAPRRLREKLSHLRFFWHDIYSGRDPTAVLVAQAPTSKTSPTGFGLLSVIDDPMTEGPELSSRLVGRAQGIYVSAAKETTGLLMAQTFVFTQGKYNGSSITILGRNPVFSAVREMPIVGGSGLFRWAKGYVQARTQELVAKTGDATVEYNVYVMHY